MDVESKQTIDEAIDRFFASVNSFVTKLNTDLDGWTLEINIPTITIKLSKPKEISK